MKKGLNAIEKDDSIKGIPTLPWGKVIQRETACILSATVIRKIVGAFHFQTRGRGTTALRI